MKSESDFVGNTVMPALRKLPRSSWERIEQKSIRGTADIIGCLNGDFVWLEAKKSKDHQAGALQSHKMGRFKDAGAIAFKIDPDNWPEIYEILSAMVSDLVADARGIEVTRRYEI